MQPIEHKTEAVGKIFGTSKIKHTWIFRVYQKTHTIDLFESRVSGNFRVVLDEKSDLYNGALSGLSKEFIFDFDINGVNLQIRPFGNGFELFCQGKSFSYLQKNPIVEQTRMSNSDPQFGKKGSNTSGNQGLNDQVLQGMLQNGLRRHMDSINQRHNSIDGNFLGPPSHSNSQNSTGKNYSGFEPQTAQNIYSGFEPQSPPPMNQQPYQQGGYMNPGYNAPFSPGIPTSNQNYGGAPVLDPYAMLGIQNPNQLPQGLTPSFPNPGPTPSFPNAYRPPIPNANYIRIVETCALERRGDYFMQIDFPEMTSNNEGIYRMVHNMR